jgi:type I site-specific restriction endonuclease
LTKNSKTASGNLLDSYQVRFESHTRDGRADYLLMDKNGGVLCVLEAKRDDKDPYDAKEQARGVQSAQGKSAERVEALYQSMLSRAFAGEL